MSFINNLLSNPYYSDPTFKHLNTPTNDDYDDVYSANQPLDRELLPTALNFEDINDDQEDLEEFLTDPINPFIPLNLEKRFSKTSPCLSVSASGDYWTQWRIYRFNKACSTHADKTLGNLCFERLKLKVVSLTKTLELANQINSKASIYIFLEMFSKKDAPKLKICRKH